MASEMRLEAVIELLEAKGYFLHRISGSHHIFKKAGGGTFSVPVHRGKVKPIYVKKIEKL
ncbi:MAG TPA: type II toxin-antitoxin system HicA family toxin [Tepidisphaeraceae bacterium]|nr:type II toxin-antitoxin system HicA family toxin [Tepidisphaeraceae bacterium]